jgi:hypothetical protein
MKLQNGILVIEVPVNKEQTLSDVEQIYPLPSNGIFHKRIPGIGATHGEINAPRHSIIVLPNRPVIESKVAKHNSESTPDKEILGIYKGITKEHIEAYLNKEHVTYKKILTTPEGYEQKFKVVVAEIFDYIKKEYYLLIDECERTIQDVDYRSKIIAPFDDLFIFDNKGLISATTLPFSDPRFEDFTHYLIVPKYEYQKLLSLIVTNNIVTAFKEYISTLSGEHNFIFLSSISAMTALIEATGIKGESKIHCSESRLTQLKMKQFKVDHKLDTSKLAKYNFLTSRFYSAIDIDLKYKPDVLMITEVIFAEHSILDPQTEVIQISGRFRKGVNSLTHIANLNPDIEVKSPAQIRTYMDGQQDVYMQILKLKETMHDDGAQEAIKQILTESKFARFFKPDGSYNWFMLDNYIQEERVMGLYQSKSNLLAGYELVTDHFKLEVKDRMYALTDSDRLKRQSAQSRKEEIKEVVDQLIRLKPQLSNYVLGGEELAADLNKLYPDVAEALNTIGKKGIEQAGYLESRMKQAVLRFKKERALYSYEILKDINKKFEVGKEYTEMYIVTTLQDIYDRHNIKAIACASHIGRYFKTSRTSRRIGENKVYVLNEQIDFGYTIHTTT